MQLFAVEPPKSRDPQAWLEWMEKEAKAEASAKRKATMACGHADMGETFLANIGMGFEGDFSEGTGEIVAVVAASQETALLSKRARGTSKKAKRLSGAQRRRNRRGKVRSRL